MKIKNEEDEDMQSQIVTEGKVEGLLTTTCWINLLLCLIPLDDVLSLFTSNFFTRNVS